MEPQSDPLGLRPGAPGVLEAWRALYGFTGADLNGEHLKDAQARKQRIQREKGEQYPAWVLDQIGTEVMLQYLRAGARVVQIPIVIQPRADAPRFGNRISANARILASLFLSLAKSWSRAP